MSKDVLKYNLMSQIRNEVQKYMLTKGKIIIRKKKEKYVMCLSVCRITGNTSSTAGSWEWSLDHHYHHSGGKIL